MKITKSQLRRIIKEEKAKLLNEDANAGMNALMLIDAIGFAVQDSLDEEMGLRPDEMETTLAALLSKKADIMSAIEGAFAAHQKKLGLMGGNPKPRR
jgi:hypothetical protein